MPTAQTKLKNHSNLIPLPVWVKMTGVSITRQRMTAIAEIARRRSQTRSETALMGFGLSTEAIHFGQQLLVREGFGDKLVDAECQQSFLDRRLTNG